MHAELITQHFMYKLAFYWQRPDYGYRLLRKMIASVKHKYAEYQRHALTILTERNQ
jgi:hypothetical protein